MVRHLKYEDIDKKKWDECIAHSCNAIIYACSWYLDIVCEHWEALVEDDYDAVFPLTFRKKSGIHYLYQPFFTQQLGVFSRSKITEEQMTGFLQAIPAKYKFIEINLNTFNKISQQKGYKTSPNLTYELNLNASYEAIHQNYSSNTKRNIKKAQDNKVSVTKNASLHDIISIFRNNRGKYISNFGEKEYATLTQLIDTCVQKGMAHIYGVHTEKNELCAGAFLIENMHKAIFLFSATNEEAKSNGAMFLLIDTFIRENARRNIILDFEGSNDKNLARFYESFGSTQRIYLQLTKNELPWCIKTGVSTIKYLKKTFLPNK